jgi:hypothetical protein
VPDLEARVWLYWKIGYKENCVEVKKYDLQFFFLMDENFEGIWNWQSVQMV